MESTKIKIKTNQCKKTVTYEQYNNRQGKWHNIEMDPQYNGDLKDYCSGKNGDFSNSENVKKIIGIIIKDFQKRNSQSKIQLFFDGTDEEYKILKRVCQNENKINVQVSDDKKSIFAEKNKKLNKIIEDQVLPLVNKAIEKRPSDYTLKSIQSALISTLQYSEKTDSEQFNTNEKNIKDAVNYISNVFVKSPSVEKKDFTRYIESDFKGFESTYRIYMINTLDKIKKEQPQGTYISKKFFYEQLSKETKKLWIDFSKLIKNKYFVGLKNTTDFYPSLVVLQNNNYPLQFIDGITMIFREYEKLFKPWLSELIAEYQKNIDVRWSLQNSNYFQNEVTSIKKSLTSLENIQP